jgi:hypothetical protein
MSCNPTTLASILGVLCLPTHLHLVVAYDRNKYRPPPPTQLATTRTRTLIHIAITTYPYILVSQTKPPTMATGAEAACVVCGGPAHNKCGACKLDTSSRHYCGKACQVKDWPTHKKACKDIQNTNLEKKLASQISFNKAITASARIPGTYLLSRWTVLAIMIWYYTLVYHLVSATQTTSPNFLSIWSRTS